MKFDIYIKAAHELLEGLEEVDKRIIARIDIPNRLMDRYTWTSEG